MVLVEPLMLTARATMGFTILLGRGLKLGFFTGLMGGGAKIDADEGRWLWSVG